MNFYLIFKKKKDRLGILGKNRAEPRIFSRLGHRAEKFLGGCFEDRADTENFLGSPSRAENKFSARLGTENREIYRDFYLF